jgi:hypothetical protein
VLARRFIAFVIDIVIMILPVAFAAVFIFFLGLVTFLLGWAPGPAHGAPAGLKRQGLRRMDFQREDV